MSENEVRALARALVDELAFTAPHETRERVGKVCADPITAAAERMRVDGETQPVDDPVHQLARDAEWLAMVRRACEVAELL